MNLSELKLKPASELIEIANEIVRELQQDFWGTVLAGLSFEQQGLLFCLLVHCGFEIGVF